MARTAATPAAPAASSGAPAASSGAPAASASSTLYNGTEDPLTVYLPSGGFTDDKSILAAIDLLEATKTNDYLTDSAMARVTDEGTLKACHYKRLQVFQLIVNLIDKAVAIVRGTIRRYRQSPR